jgi:sulfofructose kinase
MTLQVADVVGVGLNAADTVIVVPRFPEPGGKVEYTTELEQLGGQVASAMVACRGWGMTTRYVGKLGDDRAGDRHELEFRRTGVDARLVRVTGAPSPQSIILVDPQGERSVLCRRDERLILQPEELSREWVVRARALLVDGHDAASATLAARWAREAGVPVVADLDSGYPVDDALLACVDYLIVSMDFPAARTGISDLGGALRELKGRFGCRLTAATLGSGGVLAWDGDQMHHAAAYRVQAVDTTGAGDVFHAGFVYGLLQGWPLGRTLDFSCAASALNCTAQGARGHLGTVAEIEQLMRTVPRYA